MIIYVIEEYDENGERTDIYKTCEKDRLYKAVGDCIDNNFDESFDVMGYEIPKEIEEKYGNNANLIYKKYLSDPSVCTGDLIVFGMSFDKKFICCEDKDDDSKMERVCEIPIEELADSRRTMIVDDYTVEDDSPENVDLFS